MKKETKKTIFLLSAIAIGILLIGLVATIFYAWGGEWTKASIRDEKLLNKLKEYLPKNL